MVSPGAPMLVLLLDDGWSFEQIAKVLYIHKDTIREWHKRYVEGGLDELTAFDWQGGQSYLSAPESQELASYLRETLPRETGEVRAYIHQKYGKDYSHSGCIKLMHRLSFEYIKPSRIPAQANEDKQREFIENYEQLQKQLREDEVHIFWRCRPSRTPEQTGLWLVFPRT